MGGGFVYLFFFHIGVNNCLCRFIYYLERGRRGGGRVVGRAGVTIFVFFFCVGKGREGRGGLGGGGNVEGGRSVGESRVCVCVSV